MIKFFMMLSGLSGCCCGRKNDLDLAIATDDKRNGLIDHFLVLLIIITYIYGGR